MSWLWKHAEHITNKKKKQTNEAVTLRPIREY